jgi:hypothetical protein
VWCAEYGRFGGKNDARQQNLRASSHVGNAEESKFGGEETLVLDMRKY